MATRKVSVKREPIDVEQTRVVKQTETLKLKLDNLKVFDPLTDNQKKFFDAYKLGDYFLALHGVAGSGKSFCALYKALEEVLDRGNPFNKVVVVRSSVQSREMGHLPGDADDKMSMFEQPYVQICNTLFGRHDAWARLKEQHVVEFISTSFIRGLSFDNAIIIVDEAQNCTYQELSTIITRVGHLSKILLCGDYRQTDLDKKKNDLTGIHQFLKIAQRMDCFTRIEFTVDDIVRSSLVRDWIIAEMEYNDSI